MYCLAVAGALSFEKPFAASSTLLLAVAAAIFLLGLALYAVDLGIAVRGVQLLSAFAFIFLGIAADRPANNDIAYFAFIGVMLGVCILTPGSHKNEDPHSPAVFD
jgi:hypothetical protein